MKNKLIKLIVMVLVVGTALLSTQFTPEARAVDDATFCSRTGQPCDDDSDCSAVNPTCFCAIVAGKGVCGEDFPIPPVTKR